MNDAAPDRQDFQIASGTATTTFGHMFIRGWVVNQWESGGDLHLNHVFEWYVYVGDGTEIFLPESQNLLAGGVVGTSPGYFPGSTAADPIISGSEAEIKEEVHGQRTVGTSGNNGVWLSVFRHTIGSNNTLASNLHIFIRVLRFTD